MKYSLAFFGALIFFNINTVHAATGFIDTSVTNQAKVCHDASCTTPTPGIINFELSQQPSITVDSVTGISGYVWGNELGWINMNPTGSGVRFNNATTGLLEGKAWSQVSGWINFAATGQQVTVSPSTGELAGWAWTGGPYGGWITFDCGNSATCVKTTWRASAATPTPPNPGAPLLDICSNIDGLQSSIPVGYTVDTYGHCVKAIDICQNIAGDQKVLPVGYVFDSIGACVPETFDFCQNIKGVQDTVPRDFFIDRKGDCIKTPKDFLKDYCPDDEGGQSSYDECSIAMTDVCPNLPGAQEGIPDQHVLVDGLCYANAFDYCPNIEGVQVTIPNGDTISQYGDCVPALPDLCDNLGGTQEAVPNGFTKRGNSCFFAATIDENDFRGTTKEGVRVIALPFIPSTAWVVSDNVVVKALVKGVDTLVQKDMTSQPYKVDLVSVGITASSGIVIIMLLIILLRGIIRRSVTSPLG